MDHNNKTKIKHLRTSTTRMGLDSETLLVIKLPDPKILRAVSRSLLLALIFITFPCIGSYLRGISGVSDRSGVNEPAGFDFEQFDMLLRGLAEEGLLRESNKALILSPGVKSNAGRYLKNFHADQTVMALDSASDEGPSSLFFDETFDFVYASDLAKDGEFEFVDRVVKTGGVVAFPLSDEYAGTLKGMASYRIAYIRRYSTAIVVMKKMKNKESTTKGSVERVSLSTMRRRLLQASPYLAEATKAEALKALEEVLLEPPRKRKNYSRKIKFLPQLMGDDSLEGYGRRIFVNVGFPENSRDMTRWFERNYPKMRQEFEVYDINMVPEEGNDVSDWLRENVREEEYVVMKADAEVVEEMLRNKAIHLVDELFLECHNAWWRVGSSKRNKKSKSDESKRAYWECLALYGRVKDEGVAVHQWWGW